MTNPARLYNSSAWADPDEIHAIFSDMRRNSPVLFLKDDVYPDFWHITKHADIFEIEKRTDVFLNEPRTTIQTREAEALAEAMSGGERRLRTLVSMDPPEHPRMRQLTQQWFMPKNLSRLQEQIEDSAAQSLDRMAALEGDCDFAQDVGVEFPLRVIMTVLGVPQEDYGSMLRLTQELFGPDDPDMRRRIDATSDADKSGIGTHMEFGLYFQRMTWDRRKNPRDDIATLISNATVDGKPIDDAATFGYYLIIATAGHDTTSYSLIEAVRQIAQDPSLFDRLKEDPETMSAKIAEEAIRYASPVRHFIRTAKSDFDLRGKTIKAGDPVILWYPSGSRDEDVFDDPQLFNPDRSTKVRHAAFGHGPHMCLGMYLARQEISTFLRLLAERLDSVELCGQTQFVQANFVSGIKRLPIKAQLSANTVKAAVAQ